MVFVIIVLMATHLLIQITIANYGLYHIVLLYMKANAINAILDGFYQAKINVLNSRKDVITIEEAIEEAINIEVK